MALVFHTVPSTKTITVTCTSATHLNDVNVLLNNPSVLKEESNGVWLLAANLVIAKGANFVIDSGDTTWLNTYQTVVSLLVSGIRVFSKLTP